MWFVVGFICTFLYGLCFGSFLNVLIYRIPKHESIVKGASHCTSCGQPIKWYDNIPLLSWLILRGRCRNCKAKISIQYPVVECLNMILWEFIFIKYQISIETLIYFALTSSLLALSFIDEKTFEIPVCFNYFICILGLVHIILDIDNLLYYIIGAICISGFLFLLWLITKGQGVGFGDIKLMFTCGLLVGWKNIVIGFLIGCIITILVHPIRMKLSGKEHQLAFGPYLSLGVYISLFCGEFLMNSYLSIFSI
jgi:leader peptidase (prepilin peptidase)/N-methyltransferase